MFIKRLKQKLTLAIMTKGDTTGGHYLGCLIVLLIDAFYLHLSEHFGLWVQRTQITVVNDT